MAKSVTKGKTAAAAPEGKTKKQEKSVASIDDIFAKPAKKVPAVASSSSSSTRTKPSSSAAVASASTSASGSGAESSEKKKKKKNKVAASFDPSTELSEPTPAKSAVKPELKSRVVEVVDPSIPQPSKMEAAAPSVGGKKAKKRERGDVEADEAFKDSRGDGPSESNIRLNCAIFRLM